MKKELVKKPEMKLVGLSARTNNKKEQDPEKAKIGDLASQFWTDEIGTKISHRVNPGVILSVYTDYVSDEHGDYTYFIGEEVDSFESVPDNLQQLVIPASTYQKFTTVDGKMPEVVINAWKEIWKMTAQDFEGDRAYLADFEVYDDRALDPAATSLDIYIGVKK